MTVSCLKYTTPLVQRVILSVTSSEGEAFFHTQLLFYLRQHITVTQFITLLIGRLTGLRSYLQVKLLNKITKIVAIRFQSDYGKYIARLTLSNN